MLFGSWQLISQNINRENFEECRPHHWKTAANCFCMCPHLLLIVALHETRLWDVENRKEAALKPNFLFFSSVKPDLQAGDSSEHFVPSRDEGFPSFCLCLHAVDISEGRKEERVPPSEEF